MTDSTRYLTSVEAAARLGVKTASLYAYVSRGLLPRHASPDGRTSLFDPADVARLSKRAGGRRGAPADVTVTSELSVIDVSSGGVWYRGVDVLAACRELRFEEIAWWLWTGSFERMNTWRADTRTLSIATSVGSAMPTAAQPAEGLSLIAAATAAAHKRRPPVSGTNAASDVMATLVQALPGPGSGAAQFAIALASKLGPHAVPRRLVKVLDAALSVTCERGLTHPALIARLTISTGGGVASAVAAAMTAALPEALALERLAFDLAAVAEGPPTRDPPLLEGARAFSSAVYPTGDPRARVLLDLLREAVPREASLVDAVCRQFDEPPTGSFALAAVAWACGMPPASVPALSLVAQTAGWIAHALEEQRKPTPYRPRIAYTGPAPGAAPPRRPIDAVRNYLSRQGG